MRCAAEADAWVERNALENHPGAGGLQEALPGIRGHLLGQISSTYRGVSLISTETPLTA